MSHAVINLSFSSLISKNWDRFPDIENIKKQIAVAVLAQSELTGQELGFYTPPQEIKEVHLTFAAQDQIRCMWHGHREVGKKSPPDIPLRIYVCGFGQEAGATWASIEVLPGLENWEVN